MATDLDKLTGRIVLPGNPEYDDARTEYNTFLIVFL